MSDILKIVKSEFSSHGFSAHGGHTYTQNLTQPWVGTVYVDFNRFSLSANLGIVNIEYLKIVKRNTDKIYKKHGISMRFTRAGPPLFMVSLSYLLKESGFKNAPWTYNGEPVEDSAAYEFARAISDISKNFYFKYSSKQEILNAAKNNIGINGQAQQYTFPIIFIELNDFLGLEEYVQAWVDSYPSPECDLAIWYKAYIDNLKHDLGVVN